MHKLALFLLAGLLISPIAKACDEADPVCVTEQYLQAHINKDPDRLFALTAESQRENKEQFLAAYHEKHVVPQVFQEYWVSHITFQTQLIDKSEDFARVLAESQYPDWASVATQRAVDGKALNTMEDWEQLVSTLTSQEVGNVESETEFYLIKSDEGWRILRPTLH